MFVNLSLFVVCCLSLVCSMFVVFWLMCGVCCSVVFDVIRSLFVVGCLLLFAVVGCCALFVCAVYCLSFVVGW